LHRQLQRLHQRHRRYHQRNRSRRRPHATPGARHRDAHRPVRGWSRAVPVRHRHHRCLRSLTIIMSTIFNDTVEAAAENPDLEQPYAELGLKDDEYARIKEILGRRPTDAELTVYSVMWSEHCSYKSSKVHLRYFGETTTPEMAEKILAGIGENAGVVDIGDGNAVTFRVESHNHPSFVEPHQGAATGIGGIVRDIMAMGA